MQVQCPMTLAIASYQVAMSRRDLSDDAKKRLSEDFAALSEELGKPRWATNPGPQAAAYVNEASELFFGGSAGPGKGTAIDSPCNATAFGYDWNCPAQRKEFQMAIVGKVLTPFGFKLINDVEVGDAVVNPDGTTAHVIAVSPIQKLPCYKVTFKDGASIVVDEGHLWTVKQSGKRTRARATVGVTLTCEEPADRFNEELVMRYKVMTTPQVKKILEKEGRAGNICVPLSEPVNLQGAPGRTVMMPPYILGVLLGDGACGANTPNWTKPDPQIADEVRKELTDSDICDDVHPLPSNPDTYVITGGGVMLALKSCGIHGKRAWEKFIPTAYLNAPLEKRWALAQGLMDTDGTAEEDGCCLYYTSSPQLRDDAQYLFRSLGFAVTVIDKPEPKYTYKGEERIGRPSWSLYITGRNRTKLFRLKRKADRTAELNNEGGRMIVSVELLPEPLETKCIQVSHPNNLFITNDFIVTHNSALLLGLALTAHEKSLILRREGTNLAELIDMITKWALPEEKGGWKSIGNGGRFRTHDGRTIELHGCEDEKEMKKFAGRPHGLKAWDELPQHSKNIYDYVNAWNRSTDTFERKRIVGAGNPPMAPEEEWVLKHWGPWLDPQHPSYPMPPGELCWFSNVDGKEEQFADGSPVTRQNRGRTEVITPTSRTFIPALLEDNPDLDQSGYRARLQGLREPMRSRMLYGDMRAVTDDNEYQLIKSDWIRLSMDRWSRSEITKARREGRPLGIRLDVAALDVAIRGEDNCCLAKKFGTWIDALRIWPGAKFQTGKDVADAVVHHLTEHDLVFNQVPLLIDTLAEPGGRTVEAFGLSYPNFQAIPINFGASSRYVAKAGRVRTLNVRAEAYWKLSELLDPTAGPPETRLMLPDDPDLFKDLCAIRYKDGGSTIQMESKKEIKKRIGRSTDRADAVAMLTLKSRNSGWLPPTETDHRGGGQTDLTRRQVSQFMGADLGSRIW